MFIYGCDRMWQHPQLVGVRFLFIDALREF